MGLWWKQRPETTPEKLVHAMILSEPGIEERSKSPVMNEIEDFPR